MEIREFHDALIVGVDPVGPDLRLRLERVSVYDGDRLVRQEGGVLRLEGIHDNRIDGLPAALRLLLEYGHILDWTLESGVGRVLIEWVDYAPTMRQVSDWTFRFQASSWDADFEHTD